MSRGRRSSGLLQRPPLEGYYVYAFSALLGFFAADLAILQFRPAMFPEAEPPQRPRRIFYPQPVDTQVITQRNIFNSDGVIPPPITQEGGGDKETPQPSSLPLQLLGTIVHLNPKKSVASIQVRGNPQAGGFSPEEDIEGLAEMVRVERKRAIFRNKNNNRLEFIEIKEEGKLNFGIKPSNMGAELIQQAGNDFNLNRTDVSKFTSPNELQKIVMQARCTDPVTNPRTGAVEGFRCVYVQPGSLIEKLGIKSGDVIKKVNGEPINSPAKAVSLLAQLKTASSVEITVERDGSEETLRYSIR